MEKGEKDNWQAQFICIILKDISFMKKRVLISLQLIVLSAFCYAQPVTESERMRRDYLEERTDSSKKILKHLVYIHSLIESYDRQKEMGYELQKVKGEIDRNDAGYFLPDYYFYNGRYLYGQGDYLNSIIFFEKAIYRANAETENTFKNKGALYINLGLSYSMINDWENAQVSYQKGIDELQKTKDYLSISVAYMNTAYLFSDAEDWDNTEASLRNAVEYLKKDPDPEFAVNIYASLSLALSNTGKYSEAKDYLVKSEAALKNGKTAMSLTFYYIAVAEYLFRTGKLAAAASAHENALVNSRKWGDSAFVADVLENAGRTQSALKNFTAAEAYFNESLQLASKYNYLPQLKLTLRQLLQLYTEQGMYKEAAAISSRLINVSDSLFKAQNNNRRIIMDARYESEQKDSHIRSQNAEIQKKNTFNYILGGSAIALLVISLLSYRTYKQKQKIQQQRIGELEREKQLTATEAVLKGEEQERTRLARDLHDGLGGMLSGIKYSFASMKTNLVLTPENQQAFERSMDMLDSSIQEMRRVAHNMMPEGLVKFGLDTALKDFCNEINQSGALHITYQSIGMNNAAMSQTIAITVYRIVQELVNNILKHASARNAIVQLSNVDHTLNITVEDDGRGFEPDTLEKVKGIGWANIRNRIEFLKGRLDINSQPGKGTSVLIELNI